ncbi:hypothetical protein C0Q70_03598 [Pomacea canaliculata]|uniref:Signal recognition particle receptor subunit beta n=1 Tax=Pomacea canaliculata TaxID=400727 RepID=A0A2T7PT56_POMCA|nr:hypothetical protein C0Q70_03598 [Pomacea canaliculata]
MFCSEHEAHETVPSIYDDVDIRVRYSARLLFLTIRGQKGSKRQGILLTGICDSGKTLLFSRLVYKSFKTTFTSIKVNSGTLKIPEKNKSIPVVDLPGHERLRSQNLDEHKGLARGIIFMVDSGAVQKDIKEVAEYLYTILTDNVISKNSPPVLVACNKQDLTLCKGATVIKSLLEKELNTLRMTRGAALQGTDNSANNNVYLGRHNKDFEFADLKSFQVEFVECSARGKSEESNGDTECVLEWIARVA